MHSLGSVTAPHHGDSVSKVGRLRLIIVQSICWSPASYQRGQILHPVQRQLLCYYSFWDVFEGCDIVGAIDAVILYSILHFYKELKKKKTTDISC